MMTRRVTNSLVSQFPLPPHEQFLHEIEEDAILISSIDPNYERPSFPFAPPRAPSSSSSHRGAFRRRTGRYKITGGGPSPVWVLRRNAAALRLV